MLSVFEYDEWLDKVDMVEIMFGFVKKRRPSLLSLTKEG